MDATEIGTSALSRPANHVYRQHCGGSLPADGLPVVISVINQNQKQWPILPTTSLSLASNSKHYLYITYNL